MKQTGLLKRGCSILLTFCMITGLMGGYASKTLAADDPTPESLGYTRITIEDFGIAEGTYAKGASSSNHRAGTYSGSGLDMTYLDADLSFDATDAQTSLRFASSNGWAGIQICTKGGNLRIFDALVGGGKTYTPAQLGVTSLTEVFNLKLGVKVGEKDSAGKCDITYCLWINDKLIDRDITLSGVGSTGKMLGIYTPSGTITIKIPEEKTDDTIEYKELTFADFGLADGVFDGGLGLGSLPAGIDTWDKVAVSGEVQFQKAGSGSYIRFGGGENAFLTPVNIFHDGSLKLWDHAGLNFGGKAWPDVSIADAISLRMTFDIKGNDLLVGVYVNEELKGSHTYPDYADKMGKKLLVYSAAGSPVRIASTEGNCTAASFTDFGLENQEITGAEKVAAYQNGNSLDGVALEDYVTFSKTPDGTYLYLASAASNAWFGIRVEERNDGIRVMQISEANTGGDIYGIVSYEKAGVSQGQEFKLKAAFDYVNDTDLLFRLYVNDVLQMTVFRRDVVQHLGNRIFVYARANNTIKIGKEEPEDTTEYKELTFADFGIADGAFDGELVLGSLPAGIDSWNKVAVSGKVQFQKAGSGTYIRFGGGENAFLTPVNVFYDGSLKLWDDAGLGFGGKGWPEVSIDEAIPLRMTFDIKGNDLLVGVYVNEELKGSHTYPDYADKMGKKLLVYSAAGSPVRIASTEGNCTAASFTDFGLENQEITGAEKVAAYQNGNSLDGVALEDYVTFSKTPDGTYLYLASAASNAWFGIRVEERNDGIRVMQVSKANTGGDIYGTVSYEKAGVSQGQEFKLKTTFDYVNDTDLLFRFYVNDVLMMTVFRQGAVPYIGNRIFAYASEGNTLKLGKAEEKEPLPQKTPEELGFTQIRPCDFELEDGEYGTLKGDGANSTGKYTGKDSLDGTYFDVNLSYRGLKLTMGTSLRYAGTDGWQGIQIAVDGNQLLLFNAEAGRGSGQSYSLEELNLTSFAESFNLKLGTRIAETEEGYEVRYCLWINDVLIDQDAEIEQMKKVGNVLGVYTPSGMITISSPEKQGGEAEVEREELPTGFRSLTFESFGIKNGAYGAKEKDLSVTGKTIFSLDRTMFSGNVIFSSKGGDIRYGGEKNAWMGIMIYSMGNGKLGLMGVEGDTGTYVFRSSVAGTALTDARMNLKITTEIVDSDGDGAKDDVKVGVWFNNVLYDNTYIYLKDYAQYMGKRLSVYVGKSDGSVTLESDTAVDTSVDFSLFGFTKNWIKELGIKNSKESRL